MQLCPSAQNGFVFDCQICGRCCSQQTEGQVFVYQSDIEKLLNFFTIPLDAFIDEYLAISGYNFTIWTEELEDSGEKMYLPTLVLNTSKEEDCRFVQVKDGRKLCSIYPARPFQCESYPFWSTIITVEKNFREYVDFCKGFQIMVDASQNPSKNNRSLKTFYSPNEIIKRVRQERQLEREYFLKMEKANFDLYEVYPYLKNKILHDFRIGD